MAPSRTAATVTRPQLSEFWGPRPSIDDFRISRSTAAMAEIRTKLNGPDTVIAASP